MANHPLDLVGARFGRLVVQARSGQNNIGHYKWACLCDCGGETEVLGSNLKRGVTTSCGCARLAVHTTHGGAAFPEYRVWYSAKMRCENPADPAFRDYGARGITMADRWKSDFGAFIADMGRRPTARHTLGRIDNDGPYAPHNCRWETYTQQARNRRISRNFEMNGVSQCLRAWAEQTGIPSHRLKHQVTRKGLTIAQAIDLLTGPNPPRRGPLPRRARQ